MNKISSKSHPPDFFSILITPHWLFVPHLFSLTHPQKYHHPPCFCLLNQHPFPPSTPPTTAHSASHLLLRRHGLGVAFPRRFRHRLRRGGRSGLLVGRSDVLRRWRCSYWHQYYLLGGWTNPFQTYARQIGSFPQGSGVTIKNVLNHHPVM